MISRQDIQTLLSRTAGEKPVLSVFLDMSVNSENKRTHHVFLNKEKSRIPELDSDREGHHREAIGAAFGRLERWLEEEFDPSNQGVAFFTELDGDWTHTLQFRAPVENRLTVAQRAVVAPLLEVLERYHQHGVILVDREHMRLISVFMDQPIREHRVEGEPYPTPHDVKRGGYSARDFQQRKAEEVKHFFKEFALEVREFVRRYEPDDLVVLGTDETVKNFVDFLPENLQNMVVHTAHAPVDAPVADILERLRAFIEERREQESDHAIGTLRDRVGNNHMAASGVGHTLEQLQEGKVQTLFVARGLEREGSQCEQCEFVLARRDGGCPYCGGDTRHGVDLAEAMVRIAAEQGVRIEFVPPEALADLDGAGALLRF